MERVWTTMFWRKKYKDADLSTFEKLEGVGKDAYWKRYHEKPLEEVMNSNDVQRLYVLTEEVRERVRVKPIFAINSDTGDVYVHPALARELEKPENEGPRFELGQAGRQQPPPNA
jgi:hypothetical protein